MAFLGIGFDPKWQVADVPIMPKNRYRRAPAFVQQLLRYSTSNGGYAQAISTSNKVCFDHHEFL